MTRTSITVPDFWHARLEENATVRGDACAVTCRRIGGRYERTTHRELFERALAYVGAFEAATVPGQIIPFLLARGPECLAAMLGALISGRAFCCLNPKLRAPQQGTILDQLQAPLALIDAQGLATLTDEFFENPVVSRMTWYIPDEQPLPRTSRKGVEQLAEHARVVRQLPPARPASQAAPQAPLANASVVGCCLFTSGSTGVPKGVLIRAADLVNRACTEADWFGFRPCDVLLNVLPFSFDVGLNQVLASVVSGAELVVLESWLPADILDTVAACHVTGIHAVPTIWAEFMAHRRSFDRAGAHRSLRFLTVSGGDLTGAQHTQLVTIADGAEIYKTYGQTETFRSTSLRPEEYLARPLSVGRALPGVHVYIRRDDGALARPGEIGEVMHTGVGAMLGYLGDQAGCKLAHNPWQGAHDPEPRAVSTGDIARLDEDGYLYLLGRRDDLVKISGNRVYPAEVCALLTTLPEVASAEVVAVKADEGARLVAFVVSTAAAEATGERLLQQLRARAPSYALPERVVVRSELPRTASGKPERTRLLADAAELLLGAQNAIVADGRGAANTSALPEREELLGRLAERHGTPAFVYFVDDVRRHIHAVRRAFGGVFQISYAMKCNPHRALLSHMRHWADMLDVSSRGELMRGLRAGFEPSRISFTGPAKQDACLALAVEQRIGEVVLESVAEAQRLSRIAQAKGRVQNVLVRIAPRQVAKGFGVNMAGRPCQFGIDEEELDPALEEIQQLPGIALQGFHIYSGTQSLNAEALADNYAIFMELFRRVSERRDFAPRKLIFGSGMGIPYHEEDAPLELERLSALVLPNVVRFKAEPRFAQTTLALETGRYLVGEAGVYLTRVVSRKHSRGADIAICDGGMNHHLGACGHLGMVIHRPYRIRNLAARNGQREVAGVFDLYGPLCTTIDVLGRGLKLPELRVGDVLSVAPSGAYGLTASPAAFISHSPPKEIFVHVRAEGPPEIEVFESNPGEEP